MGQPPHPPPPPSGWIFFCFVYAITQILPDEISEGQVMPGGGGGGGGGSSPPSPPRTPMDADLHVPGPSFRQDNT